MIFNCPVCHDIHRVNDNYDKEDYICSNSLNRKNPKTFDKMVPEDQLTRAGYNFNRSSTKIDETRPVTVIVANLEKEDSQLTKVKLNY